MYKLLKVKIKREVNGTTVGYSYPPSYDPQKFQVIKYESQLSNGMANINSRGGKDEFVIGAVQDSDVTLFTSDPDTVEITRLEAESFVGDDVDKSSLKVLRPELLFEVLIKSARGEVLTKDEKDSLDPDKGSRLVGKSKSFRDRLDDYGV